MIIDLHSHTLPGSDDSFLKPEDLVRRARQSGLDGVCLTEHDWFWDPRDVERLNHQLDFLIIPGVEVSAEEGHFLVFGVTKYTFGMHRGPTLKRLVEEAGGAMVLAHPYRRQFYADSDDDGSAYAQALQRACESPAFLLADAIETLNGRGTARENAFSQELSARLGFKGTGGSDAHLFSEIGACATRFEKKIASLEEFICELKAGRFQAVDLRRKTTP